jgi:hypothetical protein
LVKVSRPSHSDVLDYMRREIHKTRERVEASLPEMLDQAKKLRESAARFSRLNKRDFLKDALEMTALNLERQAESEKNKLAVLDRFEEMLKDYSYQFEEETQTFNTAFGRFSFIISR